MTREETVSKTLATFQKVFGEAEKINEQMSADDIRAWDSLNHIMLIQELEKTFNLKFNLFEIIEIRDVAGMVDYIFSKIGS
ncbi:MAG: acyl carrier protein [Bacteroidales bacterium]|nr:acyl carrier protein [Bacteroidales bacterium]